MRVNVDRLGLSLTMGLTVALCVPQSGCKKAGGESTAPASADETLAGGEAGEADPLGELDQLESRMRSMGLRTASRDQQDKGAVASDAEASDALGAMEDEVAGEAVEEAPAPTEAHTAPPPSGPAREGRLQDTCTDVCSLSDSICSLEERICDLAESHRDDPVYADACMRASEDCDVAGDACQDCRS